MSAFLASPRLAPFIDLAGQFQPLAWSRPLTPLALFAPLLFYYAALYLLSGRHGQSAPSLLARGCAFVAILAFLRLPIFYHLPFAALTYQLALIGCFGACRVVDLFFLTEAPPVRLQRQYTPIDEEERGRKGKSPRDKKREESRQSSRNSMLSDLDELVTKASDAVHDVLTPDMVPYKQRTEKATTGRLSTWARCVWAFDLFVAMRGVGWDFTSADVKHTKITWRPTPLGILWVILSSNAPMLLGCWLALGYLYDTSLLNGGDYHGLPFYMRAVAPLAHGGMLFALFALGYNAAAFLCGLLFPLPVSEATTHNLFYFPPLNSLSLLRMASVRDFWSKAWHRLFARVFLLFGVYPGQYVQRLCLSSLSTQYDKEYDVGKVLGAFFTSGCIHAVGSWAISGASLDAFSYEWGFFFANGLAVLVEEGLRRLLKPSRSRPTTRLIGFLWTLAVLMLTGQLFTANWWRTGLVREMVLLPRFLLHFVLSPFFPS